VRRYPRDLRRLPVLVLQLTFVMVPLRIAAFATMFHQDWSSRGREAPAMVRVPVLGDAAGPAADAGPGGS
jgi:hypothetical protein